MYFYSTFIPSSVDVATTPSSLACIARSTSHPLGARSARLGPHSSTSGGPVGGTGTTVRSVVIRRSWRIGWDWMGEDEEEELVGGRDGRFCARGERIICWLWTSY
jgi:hypothetical protein